MRPLTSPPRLLLRTTVGLLLVLVSIASDCDVPSLSVSDSVDGTSAAAAEPFPLGLLTAQHEEELRHSLPDDATEMRRNMVVVPDPNFCALEYGFPCNQTVGCFLDCNHTCDGPPSTTPVCKFCKGKGRRCTRTSQCCQGGPIPLTCQNNFCWPEYFTCPAVPPPIIVNVTKSLDLATTVTTQASTCQSRADCCGGSTGQFQLTCDGTTSSNRRCVVCKAARQGPCTRSTQCCKGLTCKNKRCSS